MESSEPPFREAPVVTVQESSSKTIPVIIDGGEKESKIIHLPRRLPFPRKVAPEAPEPHAGAPLVVPVPITQLEGSAEQMTSETGDDKSSPPAERSSINVVFTDWVPVNDSNENVTDMMSEPIFVPKFGGHRPRYFQPHSGRGKIRPGLGSNLAELLKPSSKPNKRKKPQLDYETFVKKFKITPEKPACAVLHQLDPNLLYTYEEVSMEGSPSPCFTCTIEYPPESGVQFVGQGRSKKSAKNDAAAKALEANGFLLIDEDMGEGGEGQQCDIDFTSDEIIHVTVFNEAAPMPPPMLSQPMIDDSIIKRLRNIPNFEENVSLALNTIAFPNPVEYKILSDEGPPHEKLFTVEINFNKQSYIGKGASKKKAKADAAKQAVITLLGMNCYVSLVNSSFKEKDEEMPLSILSSSSENTIKGKAGKKSKKKKKTSDGSTIPSAEVSREEEEEDEDDNDVWGEYDLNFSDFVCNSVRGKYEELMGADANYSPFKVLAGVVLTTGSPMMFNSKVIAVTTGTKCIDGDFMSDSGLSVNDCHAEILATRCVRDFLFSQIEMFENDQSNQAKPNNPPNNENWCILEANTNPASGYKYQLKCDVKFHLYINTSPCGDARIFSPKGIELDEDQPTPPSVSDLEDTHPNKLNRGVLRSKIEAGEGTIPSTNLYAGPQTWDSIVSGNALYTMSCSDKVCRWSVLGMQGALLYNLLGSLYYSSITLGSLHHPVHFKRAVYGRIEPLNSRLEIPFHVHQPKLMMVSREEKRRVKKSPNHAVCWAINWSTPEILAASKGRCEPGGVASRLTKRVLFTRFLKLYNNINGKRENYADLSYHEAKNVAADYQKAKSEFVNFFKDSGLGPWIGKPMEQDNFKIQQ